MSGSSSRSGSWSFLISKAPTAVSPQRHAAQPGHVNHAQIRRPRYGSLYVWSGHALVCPGRCPVRRCWDARPGRRPERPRRAGGDGRADQSLAGCPTCGVVAVGHGRRAHVAADAPCFGAPVRLLWHKRIWRCREQACPVTTFSERHELIAPRAQLTPGRSGGRPTPCPTTTPPSRRWPGTWAWTGTPAGTPWRPRPGDGPPTRPG
jgi:hypothetical protein